jgi:hypothetical protein
MLVVASFRSLAALFHLAQQLTGLDLGARAEWAIP